MLLVIFKDFNISEIKIYLIIDGIMDLKKQFFNTVRATGSTVVSKNEV